VVSRSQHGVSLWRRFIFPLLFVLALFVVLFLRRPDDGAVQSKDPALVEEKVVAAPPQMVLHGETMGTTYNVKMVPIDATAAQHWHTLQAKIDARLEAINDLMSTYRPKSHISQLNDSSETKPVKLQAEFAKVVAASIDVGNRTLGAFDITLGPLIDLWGFDKGARRTTPPSQTEIKERQTYTGLSKISIKEDVFQKIDGRVKINLSGIAKGYGVDAIGDLLKEAGVANFMVEIGGEILVQGHNAKGDAWRLGVNRPTPEAGRYEIIETVQLHEGGMATSGSYRNFFNEEGRRYHHIINPKSGAPVAHQLVSVTVIAPTCMQADALATAAMVLGQTAFETVLKKSYPQASALFVHQRNGSFEVSKTSDFPNVKKDAVP
jgi:FAD:protein FMN transferase